MLNDRGLVDASGESTKWRRLYWVFLNCQRNHGCANQVIDFIQSFLIPAQSVGRSEAFETWRQDLNTDGKFRRCETVQTLDEAEKRVQTIRARFRGRRIHPEVLKYCRTELLQDNYFHAVFEATKGLAQRIRDLSGVDADGAALIDHVLSIERPVLAINALRTETEKPGHKGFAALLKGCFVAVRNPLAHEPKILWEGEDDAADYLSLISLLHRKLNACILTRIGGCR